MKKKRWEGGEVKRKKGVGEWEGFEEERMGGLDGWRNWGVRSRTDLSDCPVQQTYNALTAADLCTSSRNSLSVLFHETIFCVINTAVFCISTEETMAFT